MGYKKNKTGQCVYCGQIKELEPDHIPAQESVSKTASE